MKLWCKCFFLISLPFILALVQGCNEDKPDNKHQSYPDSDGGLHFDENVESICQYQVSGKGHVTGNLQESLSHTRFPVMSRISISI